jgi:hypothetical protein
MQIIVRIVRFLSYHLVSGTAPIDLAEVGDTNLYHYYVGSVFLASSTMLGCLKHL